MDAKLTLDELQSIKERAEKATEGPWESDCYGVSVAPYGNDSDLAHVFDEHDAEFIANARQDIPKLVAEVERLRKAIDNAISLLPDGENRLANRHLCEALGVDEDHYGFFSGGDDD